MNDNSQTESKGPSPEVLEAIKDAGYVFVEQRSDGKIIVTKPAYEQPSFAELLAQIEIPEPAFRVTKSAIKPRQNWRMKEDEARLRRLQR